MTVSQLAIEDFCETGSGGTPDRTKRQYYGGSIPWVKSGELREGVIEGTEEKITELGLKESSAKLVPRGSILLAMYGATVGRMAFLGVDAATNQAVCNIRPDPKLADARYVFHGLQSKIGHFLARAAGGAQPNISQAIVRSTRLPLPPLDEQRRIAAILDKADELRRRSREALFLADQFGHSLYRSSFGDPVSNLTKLPITNIGQLGVEMVYGPRFYNEEYSEAGTRIVRITDLSESGELDFEAMPRLNVSENELHDHQSRPGELLFARTGATVGKVALISASDPISIPGAYFIRLRFPESIEPLFAWYTLRSPPIQEIISERSRQSAQQNFSGPGLRRLPFVVPPLAQQRAFGARVAGIQKSKVHYRDRIGRFDALFSSLQFRAFSGQL